MNCRKSVVEAIVKIGPLITPDMANQLNQPYTAAEVKKEIFDIEENKSPRQDGFGSKFFKASWEVVGGEVCNAIMDFLNTNKMLKEINSTRFTLIPKGNFPKSVIDFRHISCCNVIYKGISKVLCERLKMVLPDIITENQSAFVHSRFIAHNIMIY